MPLREDVHVDEVLTNLSVQFMNDAEGFVHREIAPFVFTGKSTGKYYKYANDVRMRRQDDSRAPRSDFPRIDWSVSTDSFETEEHGLEGLIDDRERRDADDPLDLDTDTNEILTDQVMVNWEKEVADVLTDTSTITQNATLTSTDQWSNYAGSDPLDDADAAKETILSNTGKLANIAVIPWQVFRVLRRHPDLRDRIKAQTTPQKLSVEQVAEVLDVERVVVPRVVYNSANPGASANNVFVWGKDVLFAYVDPSPGRKKPSLAYQFVIRDRQMRTVRYREQKKNSDVIRVERESVLKVVAAQCGYLYKAAVA